MIDERALKIVNYLYVNKSRVISSAELAEFLGVSSRTVIRHMKSITENKNPYFNVFSSNKGYTIECTDEKKLIEKLKFNVKGNNEESGFINRERVITIIFLIILNDHITTDEIADKLYVSRSTISKEIVDVKGILKENNLKLNHKPYYGYFVEGNEINIRRLMASYIEEVINEYGKSLIITELISVNNYKIIKDRVTEIFVSNNVYKPDNQLRLIQKYIYVCCLRISTRKKVILNEHEKITVDIKVINVTKEIINLIEDLTKEKICMDELVYIAFIIGNSYQDYILTLGNGKLVQNSSLIINLVKAFIKEISKVMKLDFSKDLQLINGLVTHINSSLSRYSINTGLDNPILKMIKRKYIESYNCALICNEVMKREFNFELSEDDMGYIALHFAASIEKRKGYISRICVICENGIGFSQLIKSKLEEKIRNINIVGTIPRYMINSLDKNDYDLIVSTISLNENDSPIPIVRLSYDISDEDILNLKNKIDNVNLVRGFFNRIPQELFITNKSYKDKEDLLEDLLSKMQRKSYLSEDECKDILNREKLSETVINEVVALPHCIKKGGNLGAIVILNEPIQWGTKSVKLVILSCISPEFGVEKKLFPLINRRTRDKNTLNQLLSSKSLKEFIDIFNS